LTLPDRGEREARLPSKNLEGISVRLSLRGKRGESGGKEEGKKVLLPVVTPYPREKEGKEDSEEGKCLALLALLAL